MKKGILTSLICFTSLVLFSCGSKTVKVKLVGDEYIKFNNSEETASISKDYSVTAIPTKGYWLYIENLTIYSYSKQSQLLDGQFSFDVDTQTITVYKSALKFAGDIEINATSRVKEVEFTIIVPNGYKGISSKDKEITEYGNPFSEKNIYREDGEPISSINVEPSSVIYDFAKNTDNENYHLNIGGDEFYQNITVRFPTI